jgi:predicted enzyme related to lactoylglutathione lyase
MIKEIAFFVYPVSDMARARRFYEQDLGFKLDGNWEDKWVEYDVKGVAFAISTVLEGHQPGSRGAAVAFEVDNLEAVITQLRSTGAPILADIFSTPVCRMAAVADPDGNGLIIHQRHA